MAYGSTHNETMLSGISLCTLLWAGIFCLPCTASFVNLSDPTEASQLVSKLMSDLASTREEVFRANHQLQQANQTISELSRLLSQQNGCLTATGCESGKKKFSFHKLVHVDLGGAPPKMVYLLQLLPYFRSWGATGLLIEYADTFPYTGTLRVIQGPEAYSKEEVIELVKQAGDNDLIVIPLVQTFGHLEFVLKHSEFAELRETAKFTNSLCPNNPESVALVKQMIDQVVDLHPGVQWFHVGADEVWNLKTCRTCEDDKRNKSMIFMEHMTPVLQHVRTKGIIPIMWDDMMREWSIDFLKEVGQLAEPMIWYYRTDLRTHFPKDMYQRYFDAFPRIWTASAFKGATGPSVDFVSIAKHVSNNLQWLDVMSKIPSTNQVLGIALTGWSRYDHYGTMCELLPAGIPSLVFCLEALKEGYMNDTIRQRLSTQLGFSKKVDVDGSERFDEEETYGTFPGHEIYELVYKLKDAHHALGQVRSTEKAWMLKRHLNEKFLSFFRLQFARWKSIEAITTYKELKEDAPTRLSQIYKNRTVTEWLSDKIDDRIDDAELQKERIENAESFFDTR